VHGKPNEDSLSELLDVAQGTSLLGADDKFSVPPTGGSLLKRADLDLGVCRWASRTRFVLACWLMPNGTADRTQRGGAVGGEGGMGLALRR
jgi:hypothetical protein